MGNRFSRLWAPAAFVAIASLSLLAQAPAPPTDQATVDAAAKRAADRIRALQREYDTLA